MPLFSNAVGTCGKVILANYTGKPVNTGFLHAWRAQVYAYTGSALQSALLRLFCRCECVLPNLFVGVLTRDSVTAALACGLTAEHIVGYLREHAHPHVVARSPIVPEVGFLSAGAAAAVDRCIQ